MYVWRETKYYWRRSLFFIKKTSIRFTYFHVKFAQPNIHETAVIASWMITRSIRGWNVRETIHGKLIHKGRLLYSRISNRDSTSASTICLCDKTFTSLISLCQRIVIQTNSRLSGYAWPLLKIVHGCSESFSRSLVKCF